MRKKQKELNCLVRKSIKDLVIKALSVLENEKDNLQLRISYLEEISDSIYTISEISEKYDFKSFVSNQWSKIEKLQEYKECIKIINSDKIINKFLKKPVEIFEIQYNDINKILKIFITSLLDKSNFIFEEDIFLKCFEELEEFLIYLNVRFYACIGLQGFSYDFDDRIQLDENYSMSKVLEGRFDDVYNKIIPCNELNTHTLAKNWICVRNQWKIWWNY